MLVIILCVCVAYVVAGLLRLSPDNTTFVALGTFVVSAVAWILFVRHRWRRFTSWIAGKPLPLLEGIKHFPCSTDEVTYRNALLLHLREHFGITHIDPEAEPGTKTHIDAYFRWDGDEWCLTIKLGLEPQQRKLLVGEVDDMIAQMRSQEGYAWIIFVIALPSSRPLLPMRQIDWLREHANERLRNLPRLRADIVIVDDLRPVDPKKKSSKRSE